jgi:hypothetical protein
MYEDLETVANLKFGKMIELTSRERQAQLSKAIAELSRRGLANSGPMMAAKLNIHVESAEKMCQALGEIWRDLILRRDHVLSPEAVQFISTKVNEFAQRQAASISSSMDREGAASQWVSQQATMRMDGVARTIQRDLEISKT